MDIVRNKPSNSTQQKKWLVGALFAVIPVLVYVLGFSGAGGHPVERGSVLLDQVHRGAFELNIRGTGYLVSSDIRWIANPVAGRVERILVKAGAEVKQGDLLMVLTNPQLEQQLEESRWQLQELEAQTQADLVQFESSLLDQEAAAISQQLDYEKALLTLNAQQTLLDQGASSVSDIEHQEAKIHVQQLHKRWQVELMRLEKTKQNLDAQRKALQARLERNRRIVARAEQQVEDLQVRASLDSIVQEMPMELGQQVSIGTNLAKLARKGQYIAELRIPEKQIRDVAIGQPVVIDTRSSKISGSVMRIDPAVTNSTVQVDVVLNGPMPREARPDLTVEGEISVANIADTLYVRRPMFAQDNSQGHVYKVEGNTAVKVPVQFGRMSSQYIQILKGLSVDEQIIVSDASAWQEHSQIQLH
ncbi:HlyD family efflux transporter periplasmic adaptor subunit [Bowmanella sp. Y26]|uniref:efflux RND transporter periplasmic adaptor subunit n=1 Tax=Bowmanella yangjiangensis TaxID=2811230 RepID=UPI001BDC4488|nr:HlyD family efflux transporter periplasmic adaptor subunit [Bowmanella yangjiangensis]MBT1062439.1 HlyD family efflux transporter periplasmic adaptor subunit [Bowmanella yangjiangensis]